MASIANRMQGWFLALALAVGALFPQAASARDSLGVFGPWGAFRDAAVPRCYAIAMAEPSRFSREFQPYAAVGTWPRRGERQQVHFRLSRQVPAGTGATLSIGGARLKLLVSGAEAWAADRRMDAAIVAAMRSARRMEVSSHDTAGRPFGNSYELEGAATAMDAATLACARS
jgi:hypothetical protein